MASSSDNGHQAQGDSSEYLVDIPEIYSLPSSHLVRRSSEQHPLASSPQQSTKQNSDPQIYKGGSSSPHKPQQQQQQQGPSMSLQLQSLLKHIDLSPLTSNIPMLSTGHNAATSMHAGELFFPTDRWDRNNLFEQVIHDLRLQADK